MQSLQEAEKIILESSKQSPENCLGYLRDRLNELGYKFPLTRKGERKAYREAEKLWWGIREVRYPLKEFELMDLYELPSTTVMKGSTIYTVHGIVHGLRMSNSVKEFIKKNIAQYHSPEEGRIVFLEHGFKRFLGLNKGYEIKEKTSGSTAIMLLGILPLVPFSYLLNLLSEEGCARIECLKATKDIRFLPKAREINIRSYLPEPLFMNYISDSKFQTDIHTNRSRQQANAMESSHSKMKEIHSIVGMGHEPQVVYFLSKTCTEKEPNPAR